MAVRKKETPEHEPIATGIPGLNISFDLYNAKIENAIQAAVMHFCQETLDTLTTDLKTGMANLREVLTEGTKTGETNLTINHHVAQIFNDAYRANRIANTELQRAVNGGQFLADKETGLVKTKTWLASGDACELCKSLAAKGEIPIDEPFHIEPKGGPYSVIMHAPAHPFLFLFLHKLPMRL